MQDLFNYSKNKSMQFTKINWIEEKNHTIISKDVEKAFDRIQHTFMIKVSAE